MTSSNTLESYAVLFIATKIGLSQFYVYMLEFNKIYINQKYIFRAIFLKYNINPNATPPDEEIAIPSE